MTANVDPAEIARFEALAAEWWDPRGRQRALHAINPLRATYVAQRVRLEGCRLLDVGCGAGLLAEALARQGARVTGIDLAAAALAAARAHLAGSGLAVTYRRIAPEDLARRTPAVFDVVTCMELLEHVPDPAAVVRACRRLVRPGGAVFFATLNRNPLSFLLAIVAAEYLLGLVARGTHTYRRFVTPYELVRWTRACGLTMQAVTGLHYNPVTRRCRLGGHRRVNYLAHCRRPDGPLPAALKKDQVPTFRGG